jgi:hypothetical protein
MRNENVVATRQASGQASPTQLETHPRLEKSELTRVGRVSRLAALPQIWMYECNKLRLTRGR